MLKEIDFKVVYSSGEDEPAEFFVDSLMESSSFDLGLGFFSSSGFRALSLGFAYFINHGGKMRILINDILSPEDKEAILKGYSSPPEQLIEEKIINDLTKLYEVLSGHDKHFFNCISWLIATKKVEFKAIVPLDNYVGIAHQKFGVFQDDAKSIVAFSGSANFSSNALFNNIETLSCYKSWTGEKSETERVRYFENLFDKLWEGKSEKVRIIPLERINTVIRDKFPVNSLNDLLNEEASIINAFKSNSIPPALSFKLSEIEKRIKGEKDEPKFPQGHNPFPYQLQALDNWKNSGMIGFFEMATGTGKTITSLNCALELFKEENKIKILILVPSISLADQWAEEANSFNFKHIIVANSKNNKWAENVVSEINKSKLLDNSFVIVTTYATFALDRFQSVISRLDEDVLFIADEAHNFGTARMIDLYPTKFKRRIGLSATPKRHFDEEGTKAILGFFNAVEKPTFKLDMAEAIEKGFLCEYFYFPKTVSLTNDELVEYKEISKKLLKYFDSGTKRFSDNPIVSMLLLQRKRIIHKAENKKDCLRECLQDIVNSKGEIKYTLVYVPEGADDSVDELDRKLIDEYSHIVSNEFNVNQHQFIGGTENRGDILKRFSEGRLQAITAMKCLDEGVDVKRTETAIFCSSTGNPRQFIQRRGRILRLHKEKKNATIYDMIVIPDISEIRGDANIAMEKSILNSELRRVYEFASLSKNKYQALKTLEDIAEQFDIDIFSIEIS
jgi:superfamily II DNA or RNA helicase